MTTSSTAVEFEVVGGDVPSDELLQWLADWLIELEAQDSEK